MKGFVVVSLLAVPADVEVYFSPGGGTEEAIDKALDAADSTIEIAVYLLTDADLAYALTRAHYRGVLGRVLLDNGFVDSIFSKASRLAEEGILVRYDTPDKLIHHKFAVIDASVVVTGSYNWTSSADTRNDENLLIVHSNENLRVKG